MTYQERMLIGVAVVVFAIGLFCGYDVGRHYGMAPNVPLSFAAYQVEPLDEILSCPDGQKPNAMLYNANGESHVDVLCEPKNVPGKQSNLEHRGPDHFETLYGDYLLDGTTGTGGTGGGNATLMPASPSDQLHWDNAVKEMPIFPESTGKPYTEQGTPAQNGGEAPKP